MKAAILEIQDGVATGPLHQPIPKIGRNTLFDEEVLDWPSLCGVKGYVYQRAALAALGHTTDCFECAVEAIKLNAGGRAICEGCRSMFTPPRQGARFCSPECWQRDHRRRNKARLREYHRDYMRRRRGTPEPAPRPCVECGKVFTPSPLGNRPDVRFCCARCRNRNGQRRRRAAA